MPVSLIHNDMRSEVRLAADRPSAGAAREPRRASARQGPTWSRLPGAGSLAPSPRQLDPARAGDHLDRLYRAARTLTRSAHEADDLVQETYARVLSQRRLVRAENDLGYLMTALRHTFIDGRRRVDQVSLEALPVEPAAISSRGQPEQEQAAREVYCAIATLPDGYPEVLAAIDLAGLSYREAADALGVPPGPSRAGCTAHAASSPRSSPRVRHDQLQSLVEQLANGPKVRPRSHAVSLERPAQSIRRTGHMLRRWRWRPTARRAGPRCADGCSERR